MAGAAASSAARGQLRRAFIKVSDAAADWVVAARSDLYPQQVVRLADFGAPRTYDRFMVTTDAVLGGQTRADFYLKSYPAFSAGCFEGAIDYSPPEEGEGGGGGAAASRGGFASFRTTPEEREHGLGAYEALEMRVKTDGRP